MKQNMKLKFLFKKKFKLKEHTDTSWNSSESALVRNMQVTQEEVKGEKIKSSNIDDTALHMAEQVSISALPGACTMHVFSVQT